MKRYRDACMSRASVSLPSEKADTVPPMRDQWVTVMRAVNGLGYSVQGAVAGRARRA